MAACPLIDWEDHDKDKDALNSLDILRNTATIDRSIDRPPKWDNKRLKTISMDRESQMLLPVATRMEIFNYLFTRWDRSQIEARNRE